MSIMIEWWNNEIPWKRILNGAKGNVGEMKMGKSTHGSINGYL